MSKLEIYGYVACGVGVASLITGLLPHDKMEKIRSFLHEHFSREGANVNGATARMQLIVFGAFFLFIGLLLSGMIQL